MPCIQPSKIFITLIRNSGRGNPDSIPSLYITWHILCRHDSDLALAMTALEAGKSEHDFNLLMRKQTLEREACEERWSNELGQLQESQRREYRDWVTKVYEDMESHDPRENSKWSVHAQSNDYHSQSCDHNPQSPLVMWPGLYWRSGKGWQLVRSMSMM